MRARGVFFVAFCITAVLGASQPAAAGDVVTFAHGKDAGHRPAVTLGGTTTPAVASDVNIYFGDSRYFNGDPHDACNPRACRMVLRLSYDLSCISPDGTTAVTASRQDAKQQVTTTARGIHFGNVYRMYSGVPAGYACTANLTVRVFGHLNDPASGRCLWWISGSKLPPRLRPPPNPYQRS